MLSQSCPWTLRRGPLEASASVSGVRARLLFLPLILLYSLLLSWTNHECDLFLVLGVLGLTNPGAELGTRRRHGAEPGFRDDALVPGSSLCGLDLRPLYRQSLDSLLGIFNTLEILNFFFRMGWEKKDI